MSWDFIADQYDQMIRYTTAIRLGTADTEAILRRSTWANVQHPTDRALSELGKAIRTIFVCDYLTSLELRREINEGLNVVENWTSANGFIHYGKYDDSATNGHDDQETAVLCLHLLQAALVYVNTLIPTTRLALTPTAGYMAPHRSYRHGANKHNVDELLADPISPPAGSATCCGLASIPDGSKLTGRPASCESCERGHQAFCRRPPEHRTG